MAKTRIDTTRLQRMARAYTESAAFYAALDLGLFSNVATGNDTVEKLATAMDVLPLNAERLVTAVQAMGLVTQEGGRLVNAPDAERYLVRDRPTYARAWMTFTRPQVADWFALTEHLRDKTPPALLGKYVDMTVDDARAYHEATFSVGMGAGRRFARQVDLSGRKLLLDLGGGSGAYSINAVQAYPGLMAVVFDLPPVVEVTQEYLAGAGVADRVTAQAGDFTRDPFPEGIDAIVMASNLPIYDEHVIADVVARAFDALEPGGEMHLIGEMLFDDRSGPVDAAMWGLSEALNHSGGKAHTIADCRGYFDAAGFAGITDAVFVDGVLHRVTGTKVA